MFFCQSKMVNNLSTIQFLFLYLFLLSCPLILSGQFDKNEPIVFENEFRKSFHAKPKLDVKFDNRVSFIRDNKVKTIGIKIGLSFRRKFKVGLGLNDMLLPVHSTYTTDADTAIPVNLEYFYFSPYIEYVYFNTKKWEFSLSTQLGIGSASYQYKDANGKKVKLNESAVLSYEPAMLIDYKIIRWIGIGTGVGYRLVFYKSPGIKEKFSSPEYVIKIKIYLGEIVRTFTGKELEID